MSIKAKTAQAVEIVEGAVAASAATVAKSVDATVTNLKGDLNKAAADIEITQTKITVGMEKAMKSAEDFVAFGQGNLEAYMKASQIWTAGMQDLSKQFAATAQASFTDTIASFKAFSGVKSLKDAVDLQTSFARAAIEKSVTESGKLTDASLKLTEQAMAPITERVTLAVEKFAKAA